MQDLAGGGQWSAVLTAWCGPSTGNQGHLPVRQYSFSPESEGGKEERGEKESKGGEEESEGGEEESEGGEEESEGGEEESEGGEEESEGGEEESVVVLC